MNRKTGLLIAAIGVALFVGILTYSMLSLRKHRVEVCIDYRGQRQCKTASGATRDEAIRTATDNACALMASGMTDNMQCSATPPASVRDLE